MIKLNGVEIKPTIFPDKTSQVWKVPEHLLTSDSVIEWNFEHEGEIMHLAQLKHLLMAKRLDCALYLSYLPYGRQDKEIRNDETFALTSFAFILEALKFTEITTFDAHSGRLAYIMGEKVHNVSPKHLVEYIIKENGFDFLCYPDKGAKLKYEKEFADRFIWADKVRDQSTGKITSYQVKGDINIQGRSVLIVDDICDGGATFILLAEELKKHSPKDISLYVSHGIFSRGTQVLFDAGISNIFTKEGRVKK